MIFMQCFVFDLDETLVYVQGKDIFIRPYSESILQALNKSQSNIVILWSAADFTYVHNILIRLNWSHYFKKVLTRDDCESSFKLFGENKSCFFIKNLLKRENEMYNIQFIFIDDLASKNETKNEYDFKINIVPYNKPNSGPDLHLYNAIKCFL